jgi:hypothetical protein
MKTSKEILTTYLGDILATQNHLLQMLQQQVDDPRIMTYADVQELLPSIKASLGRRTLALEQRLNAFGGSVSADLKEAFTAATGFAAGMLGRIRPHSASKALRDDYVLLSACSIGYEMLYATALAVRDPVTAELSLEHFKEITPMIVRLSEIIPGIVVQELTHDVPGIDAGAAPIARQNTQRAWSGDHVHTHN